ncbi:DUF732 domain-containing protein [Mycobacterium sp.]|uniref:DUF732 domain-containing protein n=1 Tax=Mycobacterium sp. TaxID=1785 RepID=UPI0025DE4864|nr:DUF732 domain-containing protein [Mycobacterium sp.]MBW0013935.1 DUF732 domain-containing protein [Mycobacterium sp.]
MKRLLLTLTCLAAAIGAAAPAHADSVDDAFLAALQAAGITYPDPARVIGAARWVCQAVGQGTAMADVVKTVQAQNTRLQGDNAAKFTAIAATAYCPEALPNTRAGGA